MRLVHATVPLTVRRAVEGTPSHAAWIATELACLADIREQARRIADLDDEQLRLLASLVRTTNAPSGANY